MKKLLYLVALTGFAAIVACGPSAEEKAAAEKMRQDSINAVNQKMIDDSMANAQLLEKARQDSAMLAMQRDSAEKAEADAKKTVKPRTKPAPVKAEEGMPKVGSKKPGAK
jgi:hypothetical protein